MMAERIDDSRRLYHHTHPHVYRESTEQQDGKVRLCLDRLKHNDTVHTRVRYITLHI